MDFIDKRKTELLSGLESDAQQEAAKIIANAQKEASERIKYGEKQIVSIRNDAEKKAQQQALQTRRKILAGIDIEVKRKVMHAQEELFRQIINRIEHAFADLVNDPSYRSILLDWTVEAALGLGVSAAVINMSESERNIINQQFLRTTEEMIKEKTGETVSLSLSSDIALKQQGIVLTSSDGRTAFSNQVHTRMQRKLPEMRKLIYDTLQSGDRDKTV